MRNVPPSVRAALKRRGADDILNQEGEYQQFKPQIDRIIHGNEDMSGYIGDTESFEDYDDDATPEEKKANDRIEELGDKYRKAGFDVASKEETEAIFGKGVLDLNKEDAFDRSQKPVGKDNNPTIEGILSEINASDSKDEFTKIADKIDSSLEHGHIDEETADELYAKLDNKIDESGEKMPLYLSDSKKKPLHIQSLENQVSRNPSYKAIADSISDKQDVNEAYFYALKDAFEKNNYEPSDKDISSELSDRYWDLADSFRDRHGMSDGEWDRSGWARFEDEYGTEEDFINKGIEAYNKHFDELGSPDEKYNRGQTIDAPEKGEGWKKTKMASGILYEGPNGERHLDDNEDEKMKTDKNGNSYLEFGSEKEAKDYFNNNDLPDGTVMYGNKIYFSKQGNEVAKENKQSNWYDNLTDDNEHARLYKEDAMKVNPERAALIAAAMDEYIAEKPQRGFITNDQMKKYGERLGLPQMSDRDLRLMWNDVHNVAGYRGFGTPYDKGGRELEDAQSAFAEVVNQEARNRKAKGNYFPYNDEDIESGKDQIRSILSRLDGYDLDDARGYLTGDELDKIEGLAEQYHLTADDLAKISPHLDPNGMGYKMKGWDPSSEDKIAYKKYWNSLGKSDEDIHLNEWENIIKENKPLYKSLNKGDEVEFDGTKGKIVRKLSSDEKWNRSYAANPFAGDYYEVEYNVLGKPTTAVKWVGRLKTKGNK